MNTNIIYSYISCDSSVEFNFGLKVELDIVLLKLNVDWLPTLAEKLIYKSELENFFPEFPKLT